MTDSATQPIPAATARRGRKNNPEKTREDILQAAIVEFVQQGLSGARVDAIAERMNTS
ncbi:MAG TPA: TetR/AcrR family transcriptional regulator, partial [Burkholderiaceae bacterium]|nr:TetR/AcrR family transcriptional regulator [Burkholderiaceae bacterium]